MANEQFNFSDYVDLQKEEGREEGREEERTEIVIEMLKSDMDASLIAKITKLPKDEVLRLKSIHSL